MTEEKPPAGGQLFEFQVFREGQAITWPHVQNLWLPEVGEPDSYHSVHLPAMANAADGFRLEGQVHPRAADAWWTASFALIYIDGSTIASRRPLTLYAAPSDHYVTTAYPCTWPEHQALYVVTARFVATK